MRGLYQISGSTIPLFLFSSFLVGLSQPFRPASEWMAPRMKGPPGGFLTAFLAWAWLQNEHDQVPEYTALCAYSLGWVCFGFFLPLLRPWGHLGKQFSVWLYCIAGMGESNTN